MRTEEFILDEIKKYGCTFVELTGGEPLEQDACFSFMTQLCDRSFTVVIETGGHIDLSQVDPRVIKIVDLKCPGSGMMKKNRYENMNHLLKHDEVKFVIADEIDYNWSREMLEKYNLDKRCNSVLFAPVYRAMENEQLASWILRDHLPVRMQLQLHKYIWQPNKRGV